MKAACEIVNAPRTIPISVAEPFVPSTANTSATPVIASPIALVPWPSQSSLNGRSRNAPKLSGRPLTC